MSHPDEEFAQALKPKQTLNLPTATAILAGIVVLVIGLAGGAGLHAAFAKDTTPTTQANGRGPGGYGGFRGQGGAPGSAAIGTVVSASSSQLIVKTQTGDITVKLTPETSIETTTKGTPADLKPGEQVVVNGQTTDGALTAQTIRQGATTFPRNSPSPR